MTTITRVEAQDIRFPTSRELDGSDAMNAAPDYSATYVILHTDSGLEGHGLTFTIGRGNDICVAAVNAMASQLEGLTLEEITADMGRFWRDQTSGDSQLRWLGPEKGVMHLACAAMINAVWDLWAKQEGKPLWKLLVDMSPEALVRCLDFRFVSDALTPEEALALLKRLQDSRHEREAELKAHGYPAYTTSAGWLGYSEEKMRQLCREALAEGWEHFKQKVGGNLEDDRRRAAILREEIGEHRTLMMDANQVWDVDEAITQMRSLAEFNPHWIEEPTSPDDILGHAEIRRRLQGFGGVQGIGVATGEHCHNRVMFKQLMQAGAIDYCQLDSARLGGLNEVIMVLLLAAKFDIPVCPHGGGVGLCEYTQHIAMFDYIAVSGNLEGRLLEYVDHLHDHFIDPVRIKTGHYLVPEAPGYSITMKPESLARHRYPDGEVWQEA
ncbi:fuconate dehydratase [Terasakiispira papahanaumokuakeensis]|uniref:L-fuconate dehydratase n=1 Tax=Terasakiispira papahanaumokuakeensis TaxID=197479 RepID=A0A1E2VB68_9GAMM|nr:L-fuconate dehydratase [Terasakiispira papahanaumokuakeensis]ODC04076.1 fuconate dehydratase [Terasakiispira papahanaumokuakeensis]